MSALPSAVHATVYLFSYILVDPPTRLRLKKDLKIIQRSFNVRSMFVQRSFNVRLHFTTLAHSVVVLATLICVHVASFVCVR